MAWKMSNILTDFLFLCYGLCSSVLIGKKNHKNQDGTFFISMVPFMVTTDIKETIISPTEKVGTNRQVGQQDQPTWRRQNPWYAFSQDGRVRTRLLQESV